MSSALFWIRQVDINIELFLNHYAGINRAFDSLVVQVESLLLVKGGLLMTIIWILLFDRKKAGQLREGFDLLLGAVFFAMVATLSARCLAITLPFRTRPLASEWLHFRVPGNGSMILNNWSSFPSDHAAMFFALACGIFFVSKRLGLISILWVAVVICFPRLYLGLHWPTDIIVGAVLGISLAQFARLEIVRLFVRRSATTLHRSHPELFFAALFLWSFETVELFDDVRHLLKVVIRAA